MNEHYERGVALMQGGRSDLAEAELRKAVEADPDFAPGHAILALCLANRDRLDEAEAAVRRALQLAPDSAFGHYVRSLVLGQAGRLREAEEATREAIRLDPSSALYYARLGEVRLETGDLEGALRAAGHGLGRDPAHTGCLNVRAAALVRQGRTGEAAGVVAATLREDPRDSAAHTIRGWTALSDRRPAEALEAFREALRLDPTSEAARAGMVEALKARHWIYRQVLRYYLWIGRQSQQSVWLVFIGLFVLQRMLASAAGNNPVLRPFVLPVLFVLVGLILFTWFADPLFNLVLRANRFGRLILSPDERRQSSWVGVGLTLAASCVVVSLCTSGMVADLAVKTAVAVVVLLLPVSSMFRVQPGWPWRILLVYALGILILWAVMVALLVATGGPTERADTRPVAVGGRVAFGLLALGGLVGGVLANVLITARPKE